MLNCTKIRHTGNNKAILLLLCFFLVCDRMLSPGEFAREIHLKGLFRKMKKYRRLLSALLAVCLTLGLAVPSLAADNIVIAPNPISAPLITVFANDKAVAFTDAAPLYDANQLMLPMRGVMEAIGATVGFDGASRSVTVEYGGKLVAFGLGSATATVTDKATGEKTPYTINPAPKNTNGRLLVPGGLLSDCFGLTVGSSGNAVSVVDFAKAFEGLELGSYKALESIMAYSMEQDGSYSQDGTYSGSVALDYPAESLKLDLPFSGSASSLSSGASSSGSFGLSVDFSKITAIPGMDGEELEAALSMLAAFKDIKLDYILDGENGVAYIKSAIIALLSGTLEGVDGWYKLDLNGLADAYGVDFSAAVSSASAVSFEELMLEIAKQSAIMAPGQSIDMAKYMLALYDEILSDKAFKQSGDTYTWSMTTDSLIDAMFAAQEKVPGMTGMPADKAAAKAELEEIGFVMDCKLSVTLSDGKYSADVDMTVGMDTPGIGALTMKMKGSSAFPGKSAIDMSIVLKSEGLSLDVAFKCDLDTKSTDKKPDTAPPAGAVIIEP